MTSQRFGSKAMRQLGRKFRPGYRAVQGNSSHFVILSPDGKVVRDDDGRPITLPNSPTADRHFVRRIESQLRKAKVIK